MKETSLRLYEKERVT